MFSKSKTSTARFYNDPLKVVELYTGYLHKSPDLSGITKGMKAWRRRFFVLSKMGDDLYQLTYYKNDEKRDKPLGEIDISKVSLVYTSPDKHPMWDWIQKNSKCPPSSVLFLRVDDFMAKSARDYFLIGENSAEVDVWEKELLKVKRAQTSDKDDSLQQDNRERAKSEPTSNPDHYDNWLHERSAKTKSQGYAKPDVTDSRPDRYSDPLCMCTTQIKEKSHYDVPISYSAVMSPNQIADSEDDDDDDDDEDDSDYMSMASLQKALIQTQPEEDTCCQTKTTTGVVETSRGLSNATENQNKETPLKCERLTPVEKEISITRDDLNKGLIFTQNQGKLCVSDCKQTETSHLFHKGDQILAFNDLRTDTVEEMQTYLRRASKDEVKLTILRHPRSQPFLFKSHSSYLGP